MRNLFPTAFQTRTVQVATTCFAGCLAQQVCLGQVCGMWAGDLSIERVSCSPPEFLVSGEGRDIGCNGPGHWPVIIIKNLTAETETYTEVGFCGGCNCTYKLTFRPQEPDYSPGDWVEFIRGNRSLGQVPVPCDETGLLLQVPDDVSADFNGDGEVNTLDVIAFLNAWAEGDLAADINGDGKVNTLDVIDFLNLWTAVC